ncbi:MAG: transglutaminase-like domain-containing protein [Ruminococcus flavefaciens]|nr:transglutaminase-like domain-containing protein [Ruminococcus flavefaciens]MCM1362982.1 transglutaminase-like domain-containing protein [Clostridiales bacterium]MCM1435131.1 transglutaminase-like domain-containing protein [Ruminococcus flavefaciens]
MKKHTVQNSNGIIIHDSIVMSVKKKRPDLRKFEAVVIAVIGFVSVIMSFLGMFNFNYNVPKVVGAAVFFSVIYIVLTLVNRKLLWAIAASLVAFAALAFKMIDKITDGFKFVYNVIYKESFHSDINFYKYIKPSAEEDATTTLFIFGIWLIAFIIYFFTIYHPNLILPLLVTFPVIEIGLYNGIKIPVFWGMLTVSYWLAMFAITSIDVGEYTGGSGGFVRKDNTFFPKRQMKFKVTEKCGFFIISVILIISVVTLIVMKLTGYERSDAINKKRIEISNAFEDFSVNNIEDSLEKLANAFGFSYKSNKNKLGSHDHVSYKNSTDLIVTIDKKYDGAVYLKDAVKSIYDDNEWLELDDNAYSGSLFSDFKEYGIFPQDFPCLFTKLINPGTSELSIDITSRVNKDRIFSPYGIDNYGGLSYNRDMIVSSINNSARDFSYKFVPVEPDYIASNLRYVLEETYSTNDLHDDNEWSERILSYCNKNNLIDAQDNFKTDVTIGSWDSIKYNNGQIIMAELLENTYRNFVYENYLQFPGNDKDMNEVYAEYADILDKAEFARTAADKLAILNEIREKMGADTSYTLSPGKTPSNRDFVNYFLIENQKGYCIHYATSGVILARMAGIPARYATGYVIVADDFNDSALNSDGSYTVNVTDNRSHAWAEVYLDGFGWVPFEFTAGYSSSSINHDTPEETTADTTSAPNTNATTSAVTTSTAPTSQLTTTNIITSTSSTSSIIVSESKEIVSPHESSDSGFHIPLAIKIILVSMLSLIIIAGIILLRRMIIIRIRMNRFTKGKASERIGYMYAYAEKLLLMFRLKNDDNNYTAFAENVEAALGGELFEKNSFRNFMNIALRTNFSGNAPNKDELKFCEDLVNQISEGIYAKSSLIRKIWLKIGNVLI